MAAPARFLLAVLLLGLAAHAAAAGRTLMCQGRVSGTNRPDLGQGTIEFTLDYAEGMQVATLKSSIEPLNGPLVFQLDDAFLRAKQSQPRPLGTEGRSISVSDLRVGRYLRDALPDANLFYWAVPLRGCGAL